ncbi:MIP/aquaporin family protein [Deinococcus cellulosilyticus]|uniref:Aquaporin Z 1 n=1 Tax=Deinococcus cellulosilyticus (strain DSM 18568 / NBRC 106333 / KACC 11606 / 5516J-15) TaxID=1223518 RepID=A0A511MZF0_DEIC1|nr:MIP family channel protein [Deinococcus cellulosilyticus]GEM45648.1 aquaporin Z 1 [Deinococcus cellulosilyticus NBRC 106333 = KACC 11606]
MRQKLVAEFLGTFMLLFGGVGAIVLTATGTLDAGLLGIALGHGMSVMFMAYSVGNISGAHFNPAVSFAFLLLRRLPAKEFIGYTLAQLAGASSAMALLYFLLPEAARKVNYGTPGFFAGLDWSRALTVEIICTLILTFVIVRVGTHQANPGAPLIVGLTIATLIFAAGPLTGLMLNPARAFGPTLFSGEWKDHWVFWVGPLIGAALGAFTAEFLKDRNHAHA